MQFNLWIWIWVFVCAQLAAHYDLVMAFIKWKLTFVKSERSWPKCAIVLKIKKKSFTWIALMNLWKMTLFPFMQRHQAPVLTHGTVKRRNFSQIQQRVMELNKWRISSWFLFIFFTLKQPVCYNHTITVFTFLLFEIFEYAARIFLDILWVSPDEKEKTTTTKYTTIGTLKNTLIKIMSWWNVIRDSQIWMSLFFYRSIVAFLTGLCRFLISERFFYDDSSLIFGLVFFCVWWSLGASVTL